VKYETRLEVFEERRNRADLIKVYKMMHGLSSAPVTADTRLQFFSLRVLNCWNSLSQDLIDACSVNAFKQHLDKIRVNKMGFFMDSWSAWPYCLLHKYECDRSRCDNSSISM